ncbi:hypothetical protein L3Y34_014154 [Caenorhabditis briggsae]|uniref:TRAF3-interacting protein 1 n=1 Tax=Caenorhabditis briggsae TaxID=6238 RepID=A0AAE9DS42_CAEBR|nr:hypothetical protein L3Y34_014154 [Caenorhabditis briggsae]
MASTTMEKTKKVLEKIIEKPKITIALLERPPFKFIVDIVSNVIEATGYLKNDFSKEEIQSAGKDKDSKSAFLEKLIKILDDGSLKNVKASKIMSGMEPVETNKMLQILGNNAKKSEKSGSESGSKKKKSSKKEEKNDVKEEEKKKEKSEKSEEKPKKRSSRSENKENEKDEKKKKSSSKDRHKSSEKKEKKEKKSDDSKPKKSKLEKSEKEKTEKSEKVLVRQDSMITSNGDVNNHEELPDDGYDDKEDTLSIPVNEKSDEPVVAVEEETPPVLVKYTDMAIRPTTGAAGGRPMTSMGRPGTAASRPAPPKLKKKQIATMDATPQQQIELKSEIITDSAPILENAEDAFIMENEEDDLEKTPRIAADVINEEDRGALVQKIMETKAGIEDSGNTVDQMDEDSDKGITVEREKVRQLQEKLQDLTRSAYPLARLFDFANDDIDSMVKEMERWRSEQRKNEQEEQNKKSAGFGDSSRLYNIISNLQREIVEMKEELSKARGRVLNNGKKIGIFISNV